MATLAREISLYIDGAKHGGVDALLDGTASTPPSIRPAFMAGDKCNLKLFFRARAADFGVSTGYDLAAGSAIVVAAKTKTGTDLLLSVTSFSGTGSGDTQAYQSTLDLNTVPIATATTGLANDAYVDIYLDIEVRNAGDTERLTYRVAARLYKQVYSGEAAPASVALPPAILVAPNGDRWQLGVDNDGNITVTRVP